MTDQMMRVVLYARVSTEDQGKEGTSLDDQARQLVAWSKAQGWELVRHVREEPHAEVEVTAFSDMVSGTTPPHRRPGLMRAMELVAQLASDGTGAPVALLATKRDRLARDLAVTVALEQAAKEHGATILTMDSGTEDTAEARLLRHILDAFAEFERTKILMRTAAGRAARAREGAWLGGTPPWGLEHVKDAPGHLWCPTQEARDTVRAVFEEHQGGMSYSGIAAWLNARGLRTREGSMWTHVQVRRMVGGEQWYRRAGVL